MKKVSRLRAVLVMICMFVQVMIGRTLAVAQTETVLYSFPGNRADGGTPNGGMIFDERGNLYGALRFPGYGGVFELRQSTSGWLERLLYRFQGSSDGEGPYGYLTMDKAGNIYGTTYSGGTYNNGTVFEITPTKSGEWKEQVLHSFGASGDGLNPSAESLVLDSRGSIYGTTYSGGAYGWGTVFQLTKTAEGWTETILHSFTSGASDGSDPISGLILDSKHNLYGTAFTGGALGTGTVFELVPTSGGQWTESILYSFSGGTDGAHPSTPVIFDTQGNLYGTTEYGGAYGLGAIFELTPGGSGTWTESILYSFAAGSRYGADPSGLVVDASGNLYGTTMYGGGSGCENDLGCGTVFKLAPITGGGWSYSLLHSFTGGSDGGSGGGGLVLDSAGNLYGATFSGGNLSGCPSYFAGCGVVFEITP